VIEQWKVKLVFEMSLKGCLLVNSGSLKKTHFLIIKKIKFEMSYPFKKLMRPHKNWKTKLRLFCVSRTATSPEFHFVPSELKLQIFSFCSVASEVPKAFSGQWCACFSNSMPLLQSTLWVCLFLFLRPWIPTQRSSIYSVQEGRSLERKSELCQL